jgi:hypothetical protein
MGLDPEHLTQVFLFIVWLVAGLYTWRWFRRTWMRQFNICFRLGFLIQRWSQWWSLRRKSFPRSSQ